ncbi:MAG: Catechol 1,2-dioxygenase [Actinomycetota bacterium]|jgi:protocatechuate 3,4-dioxygenase beta subunit
MKKRITSILLAISAPLLLIGALLLNGVAPSHAAQCATTQALTEGPYYVAGNFVKSNIISGQTGAKTKLTITVVDSNCQPVSGARVDIWHTNAAGQYSGVNGNSQTFLRGTQTTNSAGKVVFTTIYPGWYPGRTMHIHFKVWQDGQEVLTSQWFSSDANNAKIYRTGAYAARGNQNTSLAADRIYNELSNPKANTLKLNFPNSKSINAIAKIVIPA